MNKDELALELSKIWSALWHISDMVVGMERHGADKRYVNEISNGLYDAREWIWGLKERIEKEEAKQESFDDDVEDDFEDLAQQRSEDARDAYE